MIMKMCATHAAGVLDFQRECPESRRKAKFAKRRVIVKPFFLTAFSATALALTFGIAHARDADATIKAR